MYAALIAHEEYGMKVVAIEDVTGAIHNAKGLDVPALARHAAEHGGIAGFSGADKMTRDEFFAVDCDVLIPAAISGQITDANAGSIRAKIIVEGANGPTTPAADRILAERGITVIPDILANAGGVTVSYFEWVQDLQSFFWSEARINEQLKTILETALEKTWAKAEAEKCDLRTAAMIIGVGTIAAACQLRGLYP
jgi:glutamate dehydrogenase (NAD(P)+)